MPIDLTSLPTITFSIVKPPRFKKLEEFKGAVVGLSFSFAVGIFFALIHFGLIDYLNAFFDTGSFPETVTRSGTGRVASHGTIAVKTTPFYHSMMVVFILIMLSLFSITIYSFIQRFRKPSQDKYQPIGTFQVSHNQCKVDLTEGAESWEAPYEQIQRIDCFFGMGVMPQTKKHDSTYDNIQVIWVQFLRNGECTSYYIRNSDQAQTKPGLLHHAFNALKKGNLQYHRKIQFWEKF